MPDGPDRMSPQRGQLLLGLLLAGRLQVALVAVPVVAADHGTSGGVEDDWREVRPDAEVEQAARTVNAAGDSVEGTGDPLAAEPVVLDELDHRRLADQLAADIVRPGVGRDHDERQPVAVT